MLSPKLQQVKRNFAVKKCAHCKGTFGQENFVFTKSLFYPDGALPFCNDCITEMLKQHEYNWQFVDKVCQWADIPFVPMTFEQLHEANGDKVFPIYAAIFEDEEYENLDWNVYFRKFQELKGTQQIEKFLPEIGEAELKRLRKKWGSNYDEDALEYLEDLHKGIMLTQNVNGSLNQDQALKICKISYEIDCRIRAGEDFDKLLSSYDKLVKEADFTPKNTKNASDFDSIGEVLKWLEKRGFKNQFYDGVSRDIVDETIQNIQVYNQRLYTNESGIGEEISRRIEALKTAERLENSYDLDKEYDLDSYENAGYVGLMKDEEFIADLDGEDE